MNNSTKLFFTIFISICWTVFICPFFLFDLNNESGIGFLLYHYQYILGVILLAFISIMFLVKVNLKRIDEKSEQASKKYFLFIIIYPTISYCIGIVNFQNKLNHYQKEWQNNYKELIEKEKNELNK